MDIGTKIKYLRNNWGWSQKDLAEKSGLSQTYISAIESGKKANPGIKSIKGIADAFGKTVDDLVKDTNITSTKE